MTKTKMNTTGKKKEHPMYLLIQPKTLVSSGRDRIRSLPLRREFLLIPLILVCFGFMPQVSAAPDVSPPPDGSYPGGNTAEGRNSLLHLTTGQYNTALGWQSVTTLTTGSFNTGAGAGTLALNNGNENTASGAGALLLNTTGAANAANGALSLIFNSTGDDNSAFGDRALQNNTSGSNNIAMGSGAGFNLTTGDNNIDIGNEGVADEANAIRIGDSAIHDSVFLAGIGPANPEAPNQVVLVDPITGQLGSSASIGSLGGLAAVLFDWNSGTIVIGVGGAVPFNHAPVVVGTAISKTNNTTFMVNQDGVYRVTYFLRTAMASLLGTAQVHVAGSPVGPAATLVVAGTTLSDQVTFSATAGSAVQVVISGAALTLAAGDNASINIDKVR
ncbi:MAG: hypothetical protein DMF10_00620 [Verrucomicrobia bacterium]|nr:MAG: hypothetical protein DMF10_00620 [Verrucomicrobiota bacterium]